MNDGLRNLTALLACLVLPLPALGIETRPAVEPIVSLQESRDAQTNDAAVPSTQDAAVPAAAAEAQDLAAADSLIYVPPRRGAPKTRVGGGTRSGGQPLHLALLAPEHTGLTRSASPTLYWWLSARDRKSVV